MGDPVSATTPAAASGGPPPQPATGRSQLPEPKPPDPAGERSGSGGFFPHSVRLYPTGGGAGACRISGIAARCDWVVLSDYTPPYTQLLCRHSDSAPRHVFLSLRKPFEALAFFQREVLPRIEGRFRLISGSEDVTLPRQLDLRWRGFTAEERRLIDAIIADPRLICWAAENLDSRPDPRWLPLPLGLNIEHGDPDRPMTVPPCPPQRHRPARLLCAHRIRQGAQWERRRRLSRLCREQLWRSATVIGEEVDARHYDRLLRLHAFVVCASGGGLDPSPKAWQALLQGAIPLIASSALDDAYRQLPVVLLQDWRAELLSPENLRRWQEQLAPWFDDPDRRAEVLHRLSGDYWWQWICSAQPMASPSALGSTAALMVGGTADPSLPHPICTDSPDRPCAADGAPPFPVTNDGITAPAAARGLLPDGG